MNQETLITIAGALSVIALYSVLFKENVVYRFFEHVFLGLAGGYALVALWKDTLYPQWWTRMTGTLTDTGALDKPGNWAYIMLLPIGLMAYTVFSKKNNWMSRVPIGIILGLWSGQQIQVWWQTFGPQFRDTMRPILPTTTESFFKPPLTMLENGSRVAIPSDEAARITSLVWPTDALTNLVVLLTVVSALSYFLFSFELKGKFMLNFNKLGRWMLMIGFGSIFGSTVMARFALVIDRLNFVVVEFVQGVLFR